MAKANVLIVEDDRIVGEDIKNSLKNLGFGITAVVDSGEKALSETKVRNPDLVLMDIVLKGEMSGIEAASQIRSQFNIPVVYLTAYADEKILERAKITEPFGYIIKPFEEKEVNTAIEIALYKHKIEKKLRDSEEWLSTTLRSIADAVIATDTKGYVTFMNPIAQSLTGWTEEDSVGSPLEDVFKIVNEETGRRVENPVRKIISEGKIVGLGNNTLLIAKDGTEIAIDDSGAPIKDEKGDIIGVVLVFSDIRERKQAEHALRESEERMNLALKGADLGLWDENIQTGEAFFNERWAEMLGYTLDEIEPNVRLWEKLTHPDDISRANDSWNAYLEGKPPFYEVEHRLQTKAGEWKWILTRGKVVERDKYGNPLRVTGTNLDITERKELESRLQQARKMEALGLMAGGIAHDLNNILSGIVSYPDLILMDLPEDSKLRRPIETIRESGLRAAATVSDLLTIARGAVSSKEITNLNTIVKEYLHSPEYKELETRYPSVKFKTHLDPELLNVNCSSAHLKKALMNLVTNASEAIEANGHVMISTMNKYLDKPIKGYEEVGKGEYAMLIVSDNGSGISSKDVERIFEPFYTKKVMDRSGTGLGLAVVWNTVKDHGGYINVISNDEGTVFELYFPVTRDDMHAVKEQIPFEDYVGNGERILVVDDEEDQREIACMLLTKLGYTADAVASGEKAVEYLKERPVDLIVLDMIMFPGMNGRETYEKVIEIYPKQKVIIASGFAETEDVKAAQKLGAGQYLKKPYTLEKLGLVIKEELEK